MSLTKYDNDLTLLQSLQLVNYSTATMLWVKFCPRLITNFKLLQKKKTIVKIASKCKLFKMNEPNQFNNNLS